MIKKVLVIILLMEIFLGCQLPYNNKEVDNDNIVNISNSQIEENNDLFDIQENGGYVFNTNLPNYITNNGYTIWCRKNINESVDFEIVEVQVCKNSGSANTGYGIVFCCQEIDGKDYMLTVLIDTQSNYIIGKVINGEFITISKWTNNKSIKSGYGIYNTIKVDYNNVDKVFNLSVNNTTITSFSVTENLTFKNSKWGYVAVISNVEKFPSESVEVIYK